MRQEEIGETDKNGKTGVTGETGETVETGEVRKHAYLMFLLEINLCLFKISKCSFLIRLRKGSLYCVIQKKEDCHKSFNLVYPKKNSFSFLR